jgi:hypothetical protein
VTGPFATGKYTGTVLPGKKKNWGHLEPGSRYRVVRDFTDYDQDPHPAGEVWLFLGYSYHPMDAGLSLFVSFDGEREWLIPLQGGTDQQGAVMDYLEQYIMKEEFLSL